MTGPSLLLAPVAGLLLVVATAAPSTPPRPAPPPTAFVTSVPPAASAAAGTVDSAPLLLPGVRARATPAGRATAAGPAPTTDTTLPHGRWVWPLVPRPDLARPFVQPSSRYGPGHRGVDLRSATGQAVRSVDTGTVTYVGVIAGRGTVSVLHASGLRSTYEPVVALVKVGDRVGRGAGIATVSGVAGHCAPSTCLHLGALRGHTYVDPLRLLELRSVRLLPLQ